ncbi:MAG: tyrosine--tRNA ligase, partial [Abditibacteriota bacterium]|nr:tyrosine--tRNA ligase [Abditibacteriota bacterium]
IRLAKAGHKPIALVGGATGLIGDPSGRKSERVLNTEETVRGYVESIRGQIERIAGDYEIKVLNNYDWFGKVSAIEFLRDIGKYFSVTAMMAKDSVKSRIGREDGGISYTEFSYQLLQSYDFYYLSENYDCAMQVGGADQWGNMTGGMEFTRRRSGKQLNVITFPLVTTAAGVKFGKSEGNAVWLDPEMTSPYALYQYFVNSDDRDVIRYLLNFTFLTLDEIAELASKVETAPERREAQQALAYAMTEIVHSKADADNVVAASKALFGGSDLREVDLKTLLQAVESAPAISYGSVDEVPGIMTLCAESKLLASKSEARRQIPAGGVYINNERVTDIDYQPSAKDFIGGKIMLLRRGKKSYAVVRIGD